MSIPLSDSNGEQLFDSQGNLLVSSSWPSGQTIKFGAIVAKSNNRFDPKLPYGDGTPGNASGAGVTVTASAPSGSASSSGLVDGGSATVVGSGFSTLVPISDVTKPWQEANAVGTHLITKTNWGDAEGIETGTGMFHAITSGRSYTGSKSIVAQGTGNDARFGAYYDCGTTITDQFYGSYMYFDNGSCNGGQWKINRWNASAGVQDNATSNSYAAQRQPFSSDFYQITSSGSSGSLDLTYRIAFKRWFWVEFYIHPGTPGNSDGIFRVRVWDTVTKTWVTDTTLSGINHYANGASLKRYDVLQDYQGNGDFNSGGLATAAYRDSIIHLTNGSGQEHWYFANASTWAAVTKFALQRQTAQTSTLATFSNSVIQGELDFSQPVWAYRKDASGAINPNGLTVIPG